MTEKFYPVTHVIFDMDGLLLNSEPRYDQAIEIICERYGAKYTQAAKLESLGRTEKDTAKAVTTICKLPMTPDEFLQLLEIEFPKVFKNVDLMPGAEKLVEHLESKGIPRAIATSSMGKTFKLKSNGHKEFFKRFDHIVLGSDDPEVKIGKPNPDIFLVAASRFKNPPKDMKNVLVFEDSIAGVKAGLAAGMQVVWVPDPCLDIESQHATLIIQSLEKFDPELFHLPSY